MIELSNKNSSKISRYGCLKQNSSDIRFHKHLPSRASPTSLLEPMLFFFPKNTNLLKEIQIYLQVKH